MTNLSPEEKPIIDVLTSEEQSQLDQLESTIQQAVEQVKAGWHALKEIHDKGLYRLYGTWEEYLQKRWNISATHGHRQVAAAALDTILLNAGVVVEAERRLRPLTPLLDLPDEDQVAIVRTLRETCGSKPSTAQVKAFAEVIRQVHDTGYLPHPETGEPTPWTEIPPEVRGQTFQAAITQEAYHSLQRQQGHIEESKRSKQVAGDVAWYEWPVEEVKTHTHHRFTLTIESDGNGGARCVATMTHRDTGEELYAGDPIGWMKAAVMNLVREMGGHVKEKQAAPGEASIQEASHHEETAGP
ncbi:hypothetical protein [Deinococcus misasensis]|uniref:hypothetical protein n=1 Tax=Deinococcus misasensis TaxID=392413 RepID=UPI000558729C|nr:hypothetical protein [Deinococcus misasensis]